MTTPPLRGMVVDASHAPVADAEISWTALDPEAWAPYEEPNQIGRAAIAAATRWTTSDESGRFTFNEDPRATDVAPSVLWATCTGFAAMSSLHAGKIGAEPQIVLQPRSPREVQVRTAAGEPVEGALIEHFGVFPIDKDLADPLRVAGGYAFQRSARTGSDGTPHPSLAHVDVGEAMVATKAGAATAPWNESRDNKELPVTLILGESFLMSGRVVGADLANLVSGAVVDAMGLEEGLAHRLAGTPVRPDGSWGPTAVPLAVEKRYSLRLFGGRVAEDEVYIDTPNPGDHVVHEFGAVSGLDLEIRVEDESKAPIRGATIAVHRGGTGGNLVTRFGATDSTGSARLKGIRPGLVRVSAEASGYTSRDLDWTEVAVDRNEPIVLALSRSLPVTGQVAFEGEGVEEFTVVWWTGQMLDAGQQHPETFTGREEGRFELDGIPDETVWLMASAPGLARSGAVRCEPGGERREVLLELREPAAARGQVIDADSGQPIPSAYVQLWMNRSFQWVHPVGAVQTVDAQGRFELAGLAPGDNRFIVEAPGFSRYLGVAFGREGAELDLGVIALQRTQSVTVALAWEGDLDPTAYSASLRGATYEGPLPFGFDGTKTFPDISPGWTRVIVYGPDGSMRRQIVLLLPGADWTFEVPVTTGAALELSIVSQPGAELPDGLSAMLFLPRSRDGRVPEHESLAQINFDDEGRAVVHGVAEGPVSVIVLDAEGYVVAAAHGSMGRENSRLDIPLEGGSVEFQVLDRFGEPVPEAEVFLYGFDERDSWNDSATADGSGLVGFARPPFERIVAGARHPERGMSFGQEIDLTGAPSPITLRLDARDAVNVQLLEKGKPSVGTRVSLSAGGTGYLIGDLASDADGRVHWPDLSGTAFDLRVIQPGCWPRRVTVGPASESEPVRVAVHRVGSATLQVRTLGGAVLAGQPVQIEHVELGQTPQDWSKAGLFDAVAGPLESDAKGKIRLEGVPLGTYRWSVPGLPDTGEFALTSGASIDLTVNP